MKTATAGPLPLQRRHRGWTEGFDILPRGRQLGGSLFTTTRSDSLRIERDTRSVADTLTYSRVLVARLAPLILSSLR
jgi:hypothetical protein